MQPVVTLPVLSLLVLGQAADSTDSFQLLQGKTKCFHAADFSSSRATKCRKVLNCYCLLSQKCMAKIWGGFQANFELDLAYRSSQKIA